MALDTPTLQIQIQSTLTATAGLGTVSVPVHVTASFPLTSGTGANQADKIYTAQRTLTASAAEDLDLAGTLTDALGATLTFAKIKALYIKAASGNTNTVEVTRPATNGVPLFLAASDGLALLPGAAFLWVSPSAAGVAVTPATGDLIHVTNGGAGTSVTYDVIVIGTSA